MLAPATLAEREREIVRPAPAREAEPVAGPSPESRQRGSATAVATGATTTLVVERDHFLSWLELQPAAVRAIMAAVAGRLRRTDEVVADMAFLDVETRLCKKLVALCRSRSHGDLHTVRITQHQLAAHLSGVQTIPEFQRPSQPPLAEHVWDGHGHADDDRVTRR